MSSSSSERTKPPPTHFITQFRKRRSSDASTFGPSRLFISTHWYQYAHECFSAAKSSFATGAVVLKPTKLETSSGCDLVRVAEVIEIPLDAASR